MSLQIVQVSDLHLLGNPQDSLRGYVPYTNFQRIVDRIQQSPVDLLLLTGDLTEAGEGEAYQHLLDLLAPLSIPIYWLGGNHDNLATADRILSPHYGQGSQPLRSILLGNWQLILLNSVLPTAQWGEGFLAPETLVNLEQVLHQNDRPTFIALHHHPLAVGIDWLDQIGVVNGQDFLTIIDRFPQVQIVSFGHIHWDFETQREAQWFYGCPSSCVQLKRPHPYEQNPGYRGFTLFEEGHHHTYIDRLTEVALG